MNQKTSVFQQTPDQLLHQAVTAHQAGDLAKAESFYRQVLQRDPNSGDALHLLGVIALQCGDASSAIDLIQRAIQINPNDATFRSNLGSAYQQAGKPELAIVSYQKALSLKPDYEDAHYNLGTVLKASSGKLDEAAAHFESVLISNPKHFGTLNNLGNVYKEQGKLADAVDCYRKALSLDPDSPEVNNNLGAVLRLQDKTDEAAECFRKALAADKTYVLAINNLADVFAERGDIEEAAALYLTAISLRSDEPDSWFKYGSILNAQGRLGQALACFQKTALLRPNEWKPRFEMAAILNHLERYTETVECMRQVLPIHPDPALIHSNVGVLLGKLNQPEEALIEFEKGLEISPNSAVIYNNRGNVLKELGRYEAALNDYNLALEIDPGYNAVIYNLGVLGQSMGSNDLAINSFRKRIELDPEHVESHWNLSLLLLLLGDFKNGWQEYEWRWKWKDFPSPKRDFAQSLWRGEDIKGKTILLHGEQGLGDTIQMIRYVPMVAERGARVIVECQSPVKSLVSRIAGIAELYAYGDKLPSFDCHAPLFSLPAAFGTTVETVPADIPYITPPEEEIEQWKARLSHDHAKLKVGLAWGGSETHVYNKKRSITLNELLPLFSIPGISFYSLQKGNAANQVSTLPAVNLIDYTGEFSNFSDAPLICNLDLVITVDTSVGHVAGAMGIPAWVMLSTAPDFRWLLEREDSPWYPNHRLFRQQKEGEWARVVEHISVELRKLVDQ